MINKTEDTFFCYLQLYKVANVNRDNKNIKLDILDFKNLGRIPVYFIMIDYRTYKIIIFRGSNRIYICTCDISK